MAELSTAEANRIIQEQIDDAILMVREDMTIVFANRAAELLFGYDREQMIGQNIKMLVPAPRQAAHEAGVEKYWLDPEVRDIHERAGLTAIDSSKREFPVVIKLSPFNIGKQRLVTAVVREAGVQQGNVSKWDRIIRGIRLEHVAMLITVFTLFYVIGITGYAPKWTFQILNPMLMAVSVGLMVSYASSLADVFRTRVLSPGHLLVLGIFFNWCGIFARSAAWYINGKTPPVEDLWIWLSSILLTLIGGALHITAVESMETRWPPRYFIVAGVMSIAVVAYALLRL